MACGNIKNSPFGVKEFLYRRLAWQQAWSVNMTSFDDLLRSIQDMASDAQLSYAGDRAARKRLKKGIQASHHKTGSLKLDTHYNYFRFTAATGYDRRTPESATGSNKHTKKRHKYLY